MTYCVAMRLREGLIFAADSRTNAGLDHVSTFRKVHVFQATGERALVLLSAGNLATSQYVVSQLCEQARTGEAESVYNAESLFHVAKLVGQCLSRTIQQLRTTNQQTAGHVDFSSNFILGGQIRGESPRLFLVYPEGNFIEATEDTTYFQIGEIKYGKPIIDRIVHYDLPLSTAMKVALISFDSTMHSNVSVGMPIDVASYREDALNIKIERLDKDDKYFTKLSRAWASGIRYVFDDLP